ncbi:class I SAM-dependent methyltransferase [Clavibacter michiganensis]|uniref:class I SAM-dependent methyltransferase n=2 Tax=Clavibacter TaxID=1573 RepID=UPI001BE00F5C|nr:class I SAM-dependent methyltransferase [Clavibacter michiganensis]MBT1635158.1 methyltransferase domain-containing protein [Clavibacter michiganensis]
MTAGFSVTADVGAEGYDRVMDALAPPEVTASALADVLRPGDAVLDVGCGTGRATRSIAERVASVVALDLSGDMLERFAARGVPGNVELRVGDVRDADAVPAASVDLVVCLLGGLQYVADRDVQARVLENVRRWVRPGGRIAVELFERSAYEALMGRHRVPLVLDGVTWWLDMEVTRDGELFTCVSAVHPEGAPGSASGFTEVFRPTDADEALALLADAGFEGIRIEHDHANHGFLWASAETPREPRTTRADHDPASPAVREPGPAHDGRRTTSLPDEERL